MNKRDLIDAISGRLGDKKTATEAVNAVLDTIQVTVAKGGALYFNQEPIDEKGLIARFKQAAAQNPEINLIVSGDRSATHGDVVHVIDLAKIEGITHFAINVEATN